MFYQVLTTAISFYNSQFSLQRLHPANPAPHSTRLSSNMAKLYSNCGLQNYNYSVLTFDISQHFWLGESCKRNIAGNFVQKLTANVVLTVIMSHKTMAKVAKTKMAYFFRVIFEVSSLSDVTHSK